MGSPSWVQEKESRSREAERSMRNAEFCNFQLKLYEAGRPVTTTKRARRFFCQHPSLCSLQTGNSSP